MSQIFIFRTSSDWGRNFIRDQIIHDHTLRQGWGCKGLALAKNGVAVSLDDWKSAFKQYWTESDESIANRFYGLSRMLDIKVGDLIIIPKMPEPRQLVIGEVAEPYSFDESDSLPFDDFRHIFKLRNIKMFGYESNMVARQVSSRFRAYQSPINNVWNDEIQKDIRSLYRGESSTQVKTLENIAEEIITDALNATESSLLKISSSNFEKVIETSLKQEGYVIFGRNQWDGEGGDVDLVANFQLPIFGLACDLNRTILIQVKKKRGSDKHDRHGVEQLVKMAKEYSGADLVLISSADGISEETKKYAAERGVKVMYGRDVLRMIISTQFGV